MFVHFIHPNRPFSPALSSHMSSNLMTTSDEGNLPSIQWIHLYITPFIQSCLFSNFFVRTCDLNLADIAPSGHIKCHSISRLQLLFFRFIIVRKGNSKTESIVDRNKAVEHARVIVYLHIVINTLFPILGASCCKQRVSIYLCCYC